MGGVGPMFGQWNHFASYAVEKIPYAIERYTNEVRRLHRVLEHRLAESHWLARDEYSMADIITFPWIRGPSGATSTSPTTPRSSAGTTKWRRGPRCSAVSPYWPTGRGRSRSPTPSARIISARRSSPHANAPTDNSCRPFLRHPRESGGPEVHAWYPPIWMPAFASMTKSSADAEH
jgi:hypothetical protein